MTLSIQKPTGEVEVLWKFLIGFSIIIHNVNFLPTVESKSTEIVVAVITMGIALLISYFGLKLAFEEDKK